MLHKENKPPNDSEDSSLLQKPAESSFSVLIDAFKANLQELRAISLLRLEGKTFYETRWLLLQVKAVDTLLPCQT